MIALVFKPRRLGFAALLLAGFSGLSMVPARTPSEIPDGAREYRAYQKNLLWRLPDVTAVATDILDVGSDFVLLQELHQRNRSDPVDVETRLSVPASLPIRRGKRYRRFVEMAAFRRSSLFATATGLPRCGSRHLTARSGLPRFIFGGPFPIASLHSLRGFCPFLRSLKALSCWGVIST